MTCPACGTSAPEAAGAGDVMVCSHCAETVIHGRKAAYEDVKNLSDADMQRLREARNAVLAGKPR